MTRLHIVLSQTEQARVTKMAQGRGWSASAVVRQALWRFDQQEHAVADFLLQEVQERTQRAIERMDRTRASYETSNARMAALDRRGRRGIKASRLACRQYPCAASARCSALIRRVVKLTDCISVLPVSERGYACGFRSRSSVFVVPSKFRILLKPRP
jgi:hypothetical protein